MSEDVRWMQTALALADRQLGQVWPNPAVGAVIIKDGMVVGRGTTGKSGRPHAETVALAQAGAAAKGATLYVTLEPCAHHGRTPPCAEAIVKAGIARVVAACNDPDPRVSGQGFALLRQAGIEVTEGVCAEQARTLNKGFFQRTLTGLPYVALKLATSLDGRIAFPHPTPLPPEEGSCTHSAQRVRAIQWITGERAREYGHLLRSRYDAVLTGIGTVLADNPSLTCRLPGLEGRSPLRIVLDSHLRMPTECTLAVTAKEHPTWVITRQESLALPKTKPLEALGVRILPVAGENERVDLREALLALDREGLTRILAEPGSGLTTSFLKEKLASRLYWFRAPLVIGAGGTACAEKPFSEMLAEIPRWRREEIIPLGDDLLEIYTCSPASSPT